MTTIHISPQPVAVGLDWHALTGHTSERKEIATLAKEAGAKIGCVVTDDESGVSVVGLADERSPGVPCGAAWLAKASNREAIVLVEPVADNKLWICAVKAGTPVQGLDVVVDIAALHEKLPEFLTDSPEARICSTLENLDTLYQNVSPQSFAELVNNVKPERLVRIAGLSPRSVVLVAAALLLFGGYYGGSTWLQEWNKRKQQVLNVAQAQRQAEADAEAVRLAEQRLRQEGIAFLKKEVLDQPALSQVVPAVFAAIESAPLAVAGWTLAGFDCSPRTCQLSWMRSKTGTIVSFMRSAEERSWQLVSAAGDEAMTIHPVESGVRSTDTEVLEPAAPFRAALESKLQQAQLAGVRYEMGPAKPVEQVMGAGAAPLPVKGAPALKPLPWKIGEARVKGAMLFELRSMPEYLDHTAVSLVRMKGDVKLKEWMLEIKYATR